MRNITTILGAAFMAAFASAATAALISWSLPIAPFSFVVALGYAVILGAPAYFILRQFIPISWWLTASFGFVCGAITVMAIEGFNFPLVGYFGSVGVAGGLGFWCIVRRVNAP